jgi:very-short-patch-repair endonuclease
VPFYRLRKALAEAEYLRLVRLDDVERVLGRGRPGSAALRSALEQHRPQLAQTRSVLEERFVRLCEAHSLSPSDVNASIEGLTVDALWRKRKLVVELDGLASHATPAGMEEDRRRDLVLRRAGYTVLRYTWRQIADHPELVVADLLRHL